MLSLACLFDSRQTYESSSSDIFNEPEGKRSPETWDVDISYSIEDKVLLFVL